MRDFWAPAFAIPSPHDPPQARPASPAVQKPIHSKETLMKEVEQKDKRKDEKPEIPDVSGGFTPDDGCFPTPIDPIYPGGDYPPYPGIPGDRIDPITGLPKTIDV
jgi:hypothetical protein